MEAESSASVTVNAMAAISSALRSESVKIQCCCGRPDCVFLKHNCSVLESVEKDVHTAAKMGQVLLARHEAYMADAERDRTELTSRIDQLETDKRGLEADNAKTIEENRMLLDQLEALNTSVTDAEVQITTLEAALRSSQLSVRRLEGAAARAAELEKELEYLEREQEKIQNDLFSSQRDARSAVQRWKTAERGISNLQDQLERIEREATQERERHAEIVERLERQSAMEKDLTAAAGRLKGAAATKSLGDGKTTNPAVSHFVRDLLQDNANLQLGIAELRELLASSNDEIQLLREQLVYHQPIAQGEASAASTLRAELGPQEHEMNHETPTRKPSVHQHAPKLSQELHIHHHYHVKPEAKKPKKKRHGLSASIFSPPMRSPSTPPGGQWQMNQGSHTPALLSHGYRDSVSTVPSNRWSVFSENMSDAAISSVPTSPRSNNRDSMFDRSMLEGSCPTSPITSTDPRSPGFENAYRQGPSDASAHNFQHLHFSSLDKGSDENAAVSMSTTPIQSSNLDAFVANSQATPDRLTDSPMDMSRSPESTRTSPLALTVSTGVSLDDTDDNSSITPTSTAGGRPMSRKIHRAASHESIMSLSGGLDIHTLKARPSQLTLRHLGTMAAADTGLSAVTASPTISRVVAGNGRPGSAALRDSLSIGLPMPRTRVVSAGVSGTSTGTSFATPRQPTSALGRFAAWRLWGGSSSASTTPSSTPPVPAIQESVVTAVEDASATPKSPLTPASLGSSTKSPREQQHRDFSRPAGINQAGAIPGFQEYFAAHQRRAPPSKVTPDVVDRDALREVLDGE
ncbi:hypothetical protein MCOR25_006404 [Pyricularia grisea]|uniref:Uncharacterized protein n=1 Tax=Pyricularia grisea TaxID=148305 RepID=A0A6P8B0B1_PYRGI|nr:uncharacterized protein PgNI_07841 [Pyricularia grisea]KAI6361786.1 hypothetical protein MCOR25_006404 [Pyricularia grisea]TLD08355.1 hypothetical protein PgNI_07841 [Pyricularia grisea]